MAHEMNISLGFRSLHLKEGLLEVRNLFGRSHRIRPDTIRSIKYVEADFSFWAFIFIIFISVLLLSWAAPEANSPLDRIYIKYTDREVEIIVLPYKNREKIKIGLKRLCRSGNLVWEE